MTEDLATEGVRSLQGLALAALNRAFARLDGAESDVQTTYAAVGEVLFWAIACDSGYEDLLHKGTYRERRESDADGQVLAGVRWARNRMAHQRSLLVEKESGGYYDGGTLGGSVFGGTPLAGAIWVAVDHMKWVEGSGVPLAKDPKHDWGRPVYVSRMEGQAVRVTLNSCRAWLFGWPLSATADGYGAPVFADD